MTAKDWLEHAEQRLAEAEALLAAGLIPGAAFMLHQAVELSFKAVIVERTDKMPPRIHRLEELSALAGHRGHSATLSGLDPAYSAVRYPDEEPVALAESDLRKFLEAVKEVVVWTKSLLT